MNPNEFMLVDYLPRYTAVATISDTPGQMALFDQLIAADETAKSSFSGMHRSRSSSR